MSSHSESEIICQCSFDKYLTSKFDSSIIEWSDGAEPPDYYLTLDDKRYAVEVTALVERIKLGLEEKPINTISDSLRRMVDEAENEAVLRGDLNGRYTVYLREPVDRFSKQRLSITQKILEYVRATKGAESFPPKVLLWQNGRTCVAIAKSASQPSIIDPFDCIEGSDGWPGDLREAACKMLQTAINEKSPKMSHLFMPKILILDGRYSLVNFDYYSSCVSEVTGLDDFSAVFVVGIEEKGYMIHSGDEWRRLYRG
ncbi:MAG: hypothetical protein IIC83_09670 [Chloroflexi bacterium]|nr:hypothetical protein [Chloroflexota bacterium]